MKSHRTSHRSNSTIDPQRESSATASLRAAFRKSASLPSINKSNPRPRSTSSATAADSGVSIKSKPALTARDWYYKGRPKTQVCKLHVVSYSSAHTRAAVDLMRELLEIRYPEQAPSPKATRSDGATERVIDDESRPLLLTTPPRKRGLVEELRRCGGMAWPRRWNLSKSRPGRQDDRPDNDAQ
ncbi:hypothetical protein DOTSEDRAFT_146571 [Dothistroma septosporum NZE10]|uniref:Uncharacterized protein n=1 Tax=Dothistroma septosporum (strain NZE10 / CBS 128990) TaxID=675120 RepID=N1PZA4_DOTSN|nr:hypothetical protein DOTSEDRAFT_146571 [Dothistroma septosporum NZE10]